ncbi:NAD-binding protein [Pleurostoma richardsiae]|uniref:NAD-binding protein n=1 Tax=Pleurostoma richardsiae TaxID=41990 RepID=A0AA38R2D9_9PEZI|nr:NAD-binding protein [Pleurostoma richardsiae]
MESIKNVAVLGASGNLGRVVIPTLLRDGFTVTIIARPGSKTESHNADLIVKTADYANLASMTLALRGQHAVVEAFNPAAGVHQHTIVQAAIAAGVSHLLTPDFSSDTFHANAKELLIFGPKIQAQQELESLVEASDGALSWTAIIVGPWYDWGIERGALWIDREHRTVTRFGSGDQRYSMSRLELCGEAAAAVLREPAKYRNRPAYFASSTVSTNELIEILEDIRTKETWKVVDVPVANLLQTGRRLWEEEEASGISDKLNSKAYPLLGTAALFDEENRFGADFGHKLEPGWDQGKDKLKEHLKQLLE